MVHRSTSLQNHLSARCRVSLQMQYMNEHLFPFWKRGVMYNFHTYVSVAPQVFSAAVSCFSSLLACAYNVI